MHVLTTNKLRLAIYLAVLMETVMLPSFAIGQSHSYRFDRITVDDGLSSGDVWSIYQDRYGFMWFGTANGLNRYDGRNIKVYRNIPGDSTSLYANKVSAMVEDPSGNLWLSAGALHRYDREKDQFVRYRQGPLADISVSLNFGPDLKCDASGVLWIGTRKGLVTFDTKRDELRHIDLGIGNAFPSMMSFDRRGFLWIPYMHPSMIIRLDTSTLSYKVFLNEQGIRPDLIPPGQTLGVYADRQNNIWMYTWGLVKIDQNEKYPIYVDTPRTDKSRISTMGICEDSLGRLWTGSLRAGIRMYDPSTGSVHLFKHQSSDPASPNSDEVRVVYTDKIGNVWFGTTRGVAKLARYAKRFRRYRNYTSDNNVILSGEIKGLWEDKNGEFWSIHWGEGVSKINLKTGHVRNYNYLDIVNWVFDIYENRNGTIMVSVGLGGRIAKYDRKRDRFDEFQLFPTTGFDRWNVVLQMLQEPLSGTTWYATLNGIVREENGRRTKYDDSTHSGLPTTEFTRLYLDSRQILWVETVGGKVYYSDKTKSVFRQTHRIRSFVYVFHEDHEGNLWLGTEGGINKFDPQKDSITLEVSLGLNKGDYVYGILEDNNGNLWLATTNGIVRYNTQSGDLRIFGPSDGIPLPTIGVPTRESYRPYRRLISGEFAIGLGAEGFVVFHPDSIKDNPYVPPVYITNIFVNKREVESARNLETKRVYSEELILSYDQNDFSIQYASLDFTAPMNNLYRYKLEGYEREWVNAGNRNIVYYTNIDPGEYIFRVKGSNNDGVWNEEGTSLKIIITPPWWKTWWAYSVYGLLFVGLLYAARRYELNRQTLKHQAELEHMEAKKLKELDQTKSRFFANISHEFRTPLTLIEGPAKRILSEEGSPKENAGLIVRNSSRLLQLVNQLLDLSRIEAGQLKLKVEHQNLCDLVKGIGAAFETMARKKNIRYKIEVPERQEYGWVDGDAVEKCITNLLSNAMKFTPEGGSVTLAMESDGVRMAVRVTDSGIGIDESNMQRVFERFYQVDTKGTHEFEGSGIGLALTKDLIELHHGTIGIESTSGVGSTFTMSILVNRESYTPDQLFEPVTDKKAEPKARKEDIDTLDVEDVRSGEDAREGKDEQDGQELPLILLIEDNEDMRKYVRMHLNGSYKIVEASDGVEGLEKAIETVPDLIISDQMMPKMEGSVLVQKVKSDQRVSHIPVILLTAKAEQKDKLKGLGVGADDYLVKPFDATELKARMDNLILQRRKLWDKFRTEWMTKPREAHAVSSDEKFLAKIMDVIETNMSDPDFDISRLSEESALSRMQLHRKIKSMTGCSPGELLRNYRLDRAAELIKKKVGNVSEIAFDVGFNSLSNFANQFKQRFGSNPSEYN